MSVASFVSSSQAVAAAVALPNVAWGLVSAALAIATPIAGQPHKQNVLGEIDRNSVLYFDFVA